ncbi:MAG: hypothetical protein JNJ40_14005 [Bacteroidia bacterium]|nr:hypothetical protein [Bacteroidia bacterium]
MKKTKTKLSLLVIALLMAFSCSVGVKKDLLSGLSIKYNGFTVADSYLVKGDKRTTDVKIKPGEKLSLVFTGVSGFKAVEGMAYPGASILVVDNKGKTVLDIPDLFSSYDSTGVETKLAEEALSIEFTAPTEGSVKGDKYTWKSRVWDKKGTSEITCELQLEVD